MHHKVGTLLELNRSHEKKPGQKVFNVSDVKFDAQIDHNDLSLKKENGILIQEKSSSSKFGFGLKGVQNSNPLFF